MTDSHATKPDTVNLECAAEDLHAPAARDVLFLLLNQGVLMDLAAPMEAFRAANAELPGSYTLRFVGPRRSVLVTGGPALSGCEPLPERLARDSILVVPGVAGDRGAVDPHEPATRQAIDWLRTTGHATQLVCVSSGGVLAAYAGLLCGRECTTHPAHVAELRGADPYARFINRILVEDGIVLTSAGASAGLDLALHVIERQLGACVAANVARRLIVYRPRTGTDSELSPWVVHRNHLHPAVHRVQNAVTRDPTARWRLADLSDVACTSARHLSRLFREHSGCTPLHYVQQVRLAVARQLVQETRLDLKRVAVRAGFRSAQHLRRVWSRWEARPPSGFRKEVAARSLQADRVSHPTHGAAARLSN